jgi:hypothetical protein
MLEHQMCSVDDSLVRANANDFGRHDVFDSHCPTLNLEVDEKQPHYSECIKRLKGRA